MLKNIGVLPDYLPDLERKDILELIPEYEGIIIRGKTEVDQELLDVATRLQYVARAGAGMDKIDVISLQKKGITLINAPEGNRDAVGEHVLGMALSMLNNLHKADREVKNSIWVREGNRGYELNNKILGIIGYGNMGKATAKRFHAMGCEVLAYDAYKKNYGDEVCAESQLNRIFEQAEIVSIHVPLNKFTKHMVDRKFFSNFYKPIYFINSARGEIVSLRALYEALETGKVKAAALDVLENEKLNTLSKSQREVFEQLARHPTVIMSPHIAGWTHESYRRINIILVKKIQQLLQVKMSH